MEEHPTAPRGKSLSLKIAVPVVIGLAVVVWLFHGEFHAADLRTVKFTARAWVCIVLAWVFMAGRDFGLTWRFREITAHHLSWAKAMKINMLCEFTSAVTPSSVGGSTLGMVYMHREGVEWGRSATLMLTTLFLDELYFVIACPLIMALVPYAELFGMGTDGHVFAVGLRTVFWIVYGALVAWTAVLFVGIFIRPRAVGTMLRGLFRLPLLRRWQRRVSELGDNIEATSRDLRGRQMSWWLKVFGATALSWCSRFMVVNMLFLGFVPGAPQGVVFGRQFIVWVVLMISPTPGGSGISEWIFKNYYGDLIAGGALVMVIALFWRLISYYVYLVIGAFIVPRWVREGLRRQSASASGISSSAAPRGRK